MGLTALLVKKESSSSSVNCVLAGGSVRPLDIGPAVLGGTSREEGVAADAADELFSRTRGVGLGRDIAPLSSFPPGQDDFSADCRVALVVVALIQTRSRTNNTI